jgi:hypothetical protein
MAPATGGLLIKRAALGPPCIFTNHDIDENILKHLGSDSKHRMRLVCRAWRAGVDAQVKIITWFGEFKATRRDLILASRAWPNAEELIIFPPDDEDEDDEGGVTEPAEEPVCSQYDRLHWPGLVTLRIEGDIEGDTDLELVLDVLQGSLPRLESLDLSGKAFRSPELSQARLGPEAMLPVYLLVRAQFWRDLKSLTLADNFISSNEATRFLVPRLPLGLTKLDLRSNYTDGASALGAARLLLLEEMKLRPNSAAVVTAVSAFKLRTHV